jgi:thiosulfate/3-mercaptopyruvate sulfurtransferase
VTQQRGSLVSPAALRGLLDGPDDVVAAEVAADPQGYYSGHLPGAVLLDWFDDVHDPDRRGVVGQARFERLLSERGIGRDTHVVLYDDNLNKHAAYAHWLFRYYRHARISMLDGGRSAWVASGEPLVLEEPGRPPTTYSSPGPDPALRLTRDDLLATFVHAPEGTVLVDGRAPHVYRGRPGSNADDLPLLGLRLAGHIPGAVNLQAERLLDPADGRFLPVERLQEVFADLGVRPQSEVAVYCAGGEQSSLLWFALAELLGHPAVRHYDGGWAEYGGLVDVPVER